jgi:hypothetical protein
MMIMMTINGTATAGEFPHFPPFILCLQNPTIKHTLYQYRPPSRSLAISLYFLSAEEIFKVHLKEIDVIKWQNIALEVPSTYEVFKK